MAAMTIRGTTLDIREGIVWAQYDLDGARVDQGTAYGTVPTADQLAEWDAIATRAIDAIIATEAVAATPAKRPMRVGRYGTCDPADCDGGEWCRGDCSHDSRWQRGA